MRCLLSVLLIFVVFVQIHASDDAVVVEVNGVVTYLEENGMTKFIENVAVGIKGSHRGVFSNQDGIFSIVMQKGQTLVFSALGYHSKELKIPETINGDAYRVEMVLERNAIDMKEVVVNPWLSRDNLAAEFLAMNLGLSADMEAIARENLAQKQIKEQMETLAQNAEDNTNAYLKENAVEVSQVGQLKPQNLFSPLAWYELVTGKKANLFGKPKKEMIDIFEGENTVE